MRVLFLSLTIILMAANAAIAQKAIDARAAGMAFSNAADTRGVESAGSNPATLGLKNDFRLEFNLFSAVASISNNSFSKSQYDRYFTTGDLLSDGDIDDILNAIPASGLRADGQARLNSLSIYLPNFSFSVFGVGDAKLNIPKSALELPLQGNNELGRVYSFDEADGADWAGMGISVSGAQSIRWKRLPFDDIILGATLTYYRGFVFDEIESADGQLRNFDLNSNPYISLDGELSLLSANGGSGVSLNFGGLAVVNEKITVGLAFFNAISQMNWNTDAERRVLAIHADSISLPFNLEDDRIVDTENVFPLNSFSTRLPAVMDWSVAYSPQPDVTLTAEWEQGLTAQMSGTRRARVAIGGEYRGIPVLPLRAGFTVGGKMGLSLAIGGGIDLGNWYLDIAYLNHRKLIPGDFKGMGLALTSRLRF